MSNYYEDNYDKDDSFYQEEQFDCVFGAEHICPMVEGQWDIDDFNSNILKRIANKIIPSRRRKLQRLEIETYSYNGIEHCDIVCPNRPDRPKEVCCEFCNGSIPIEEATNFIDNGKLKFLHGGCVNSYNQKLTEEDECESCNLLTGQKIELLSIAEIKQTKKSKEEIEKEISRLLDLDNESDALIRRIVALQELEIELEDKEVKKNEEEHWKAKEEDTRYDDMLITHGINPGNPYKEGS